MIDEQSLKWRKRVMATIRRRLNRVVGKHLTACGYEEPVREAWESQFELERYIEDQLTTLLVLVKKGGRV